MPVLSFLFDWDLTPPLMCSQELSVLQSTNNSLISKIYFPLSFLFKNFSLVEVIYIC